MPHKHFLFAFLSVFSFFSISSFNNLALANEKSVARTYTVREQRLKVANPSMVAMRFRGDYSPNVPWILAEPLTDWNGEELIPAGAEVLGTIDLTEEGAEIVADYIIVEGMEIPVQASGYTLSVGSQVTRSQAEKIAEMMTYSRVVGIGLGKLLFDDPELGELLGGLGPVVWGLLFFESDIERVIHIPQMQTFSLKIETPIVLSPTIAQIAQGQNVAMPVQEADYGSHQVQAYNPAQSTQLPVITQTIGCSNLHPDEYIVNYSLGLGLYEAPTFTSTKIAALSMADVIEIDNSGPNQGQSIDEDNILWQKVKTPMPGFVPAGDTGTASNLTQCS